MLPESPRYLYLAGRREEGYLPLMEMYDKEQLVLPWASETVAVTCAPVADSSSSRAPLSKATPPTSIVVGVWLAAAMFLISAAAQSMKVWMPMLLSLRHRMQPQGGPQEVHILLSASAPSSLLFFQAAGSPGNAVANL